MNQEMRYQQLDALRGVAALTVVISHFSLLGPLPILRHLPLRLLCGGHAAVVLFFTLSGFVLALQVNNDRKLSYAEYIVRRACRIYVPYFVAVIVSYVGFTVFNHGPVNWAGDWFNNCWLATLADISIARHLLFVFPFETYRLNPILWSLVYEMRISLFFMPVALAVFSMSSWRALCCAALLSIAVCVYATGSDTHVLFGNVRGEWLPTLHYLLMFVTGAVLAKHRRYISARLGGTPAAARIGMILLAGSVVLYLIAERLSYFAPKIPGDFVFEWLVLIAASGIISCAVALAPFARFLQLPPLPFLGRISYSLYLYHAVVLFGIVHFVGERFGPAITLTLAAALIVPVSYAGYRFVERPGMQLGHRLARRFQAARVLAESVPRS
ncbi:peptidoglycan/LPS O-acetylase OafA/YrhL [Paraburkholderia sp. GAS448]|uniref:acyltransferase family protein n=1 Tax=Paraburkholderia sp. GAS448 TaxID=3035136 RepID=UPI003D22724B